MTFAPSRLEQAIARLDALADAPAREVAREAMAAMLAYHGEGLRRLAERLRDTSGGGDRLLEAALGDELVASMLLLHRVHPLPLEARVRRALDDVRASARGAADGIEVLSMDAAAIRLRVTGTEHLRRTVARAVEEAAPEVEQIEVLLLERDPGLVPLTRLTRRREASHDRCELCGQPLAAEHDHVFEIEHRRVKCACSACSILFDTPASKVRRIRREARRLEDFRISEAQWTALRVPVGLAFFSYSSSAGEVIAGYPGPAGATESVVPMPAWQEVVTNNPVLADLEPDTAALLIDRLTRTPTYHIVSIDECYRLTGLVRSRWQGLTGGDGPIHAVRELFEGSPEARR